MIDINNALLNAAQQLEQAADCHGQNISSVEAQYILMHVLAVSRAHLRAYPEQILNDLDYARFMDLVALRAQGQPLAYLTGTKEFWGMQFFVNAHTLIPRPDSEILIETILGLAWIKNLYCSKAQTLNILDLGTGTGALALALKKEIPLANVFACDFSSAAVALAQKNSAHLNLPLNLRQSDWFAAYPLHDFADFFDIIIANPPYIAADDPHLAGDGIKFEPLSALVAENEGLSDIIKIIATAQSYLKKDPDTGMLIIEHGYNQSSIIYNLFKDARFTNIELIKDYNAQDRCTLGYAHKLSVP